MLKLRLKVIMQNQNIMLGIIEAVEVYGFEH
ncbi:Uncharacterised protein [Orientia tsutsugamushi]|uniref:Uncharacterized protein n=1 Tax=Orientia tsutsugamushi TaxID=784 RepID=A0A2R8F218_ORITS|nr:Uncharacterised protein [Orientia tsutsugamushi]